MIFNKRWNSLNLSPAVKSEVNLLHNVAQFVINKFPQRGQHVFFRTQKQQHVPSRITRL